MGNGILAAMARGGFERVLALQDRRSGLRGYLAIHDTSVGPALGGVRRWAYRSEDQALRDCTRLARAMTLKCCLAGLDAGGAKTVLLDHPDVRWEEAYPYLGRVVEDLGGAVSCGPDVGTGERELGWLASETRHVTRPGARGPGRLSAATAEGVFRGMQAALEHLDGEADWERRRVVIQGLGAVGRRLAEQLLRAGARVAGCDLDPRRAETVAEELGLELLDPARELGEACDVFAPCALGGILHDLSIPRLKARIVAGSANNPLARGDHADALHARGVLLVPDFVISAGALVRGARFHLDGRREPIGLIGERIGETVRGVLERAAAEGCPPQRTAEREAERLLEERRSGDLPARTLSRT
ncbi:MAG: Glu/Leu/Phe/Val dehydrogenase dimerization domain-containing protein [Planctomycetota bacterium]|jgi:leucine dehydrogenase|nr:Glu/Leu/Phe/Val dehydrogenase dimerization domain-containing protein [Planctomycetota bacterium]